MPTKDNSNNSVPTVQHLPSKSSCQELAIKIQRLHIGVPGIHDTTSSTR